MDDFETPDNGLMGPAEFIHRLRKAIGVLPRTELDWLTVYNAGLHRARDHRPKPCRRFAEYCLCLGGLCLTGVRMGEVVRDREHYEALMSGQRYRRHGDRRMRQKPHEPEYERA